MSLNAGVIAALVAGTAALLSAVFSFIALVQVRKNRKASAYTRISNLYDQLISFRIGHPEVLSLSRKWTSEKLRQVYDGSNKKNKQWVKYYTFVELCIGYCNAVIHARKRKLIGKDAYENQHKPLVKLLLTEHNPIIEDLVHEKKYISFHIRDFRQNLKKEEGWDWEEEYEELINIPPRVAP